MNLSPIGQAIPSFGAETLEGLEISPDIQDGQRIGGSSRRQFVRFYKKRISEIYATKVKPQPGGGVQVLETAPREVEREFVHVRTPGDKNEIETFAEDYHRRAFFANYKAFRDGKGIPLGTPIEECTYVAPSIQTELKYLGCHTEEQLADASDILVDQIPDGYSLREFARASCKVKVDNAASGQVNLLRAENIKLQETVARLAQEMDKVKSLVNPQGEEIAVVAKTAVGRKKKFDLEA